MRKKTNYVNNKDLYESLVKYNNDKKKLDNIRIPEYVGKCIILIAERLATKSNFIGYSYKDEMIADGIENCLMAAPYFDPERTKNPFAYFTRIMWFAFIRRIQKEKRQHYLKLKNFKNHVASAELNNSMPGLYNPASEADDEVIDTFISEYERKANEKKVKAKKKKTGIENFYEEKDE